MKKLKAFVAAALALTLLVGCSGGSSDAGSNGSTLVIAKENGIESVDLLKASTGMDFEVVNAFCEGLTGIDKDNKVYNALAADYKVNEDETVYTFTLKDAKWSNGDPVTANDFVYSWRRTAQKGEDYQYFFTDDMACIKNGNDVTAGKKKPEELGIKAIDEKTLEITLSKPTPYFLSLLAFPTSFPMNEKFVTGLEKDGKKYGDQSDMANCVLACGPFVLTNFVQDSVIEFKKNENYYDADKIKLDGIKMNIVKNVSTSALDFDSGNCDITKINSSLVDKYKDGKTFNSMLEGYLWFLQYNIGSKGNKYLKNANIRKAISYAVDRQDLVDNVLKDGSVAARGFMPTSFAYDQDGKDYCDTAAKYMSTDLAKAQELFDKGLKELGVSSINLRLLYEKTDPANPAAEFIQSQLAKLKGLSIEMTGVDQKNSRTQKQTDRDFDITLTRWGPDYADPTTYLTLMTKGHYFNYGDFDNSKYDAKIKAINSETDKTKRWKLCQEAEAILFEDDQYPVVPLFQTGGAILIGENIEGLEVHTFGTPYIYKNVVKK